MYDIIGDVHGYMAELELLLTTMGYSSKAGFWSHPTRKAIFVGDFINRGPNSKGVLSLIRKMVEAKSGFAILGNHELNAICYFTYNSAGKPLRHPSMATALELDQIKMEYKVEANPINMELFERDIKWLRKLPFYLEFNGFRVAHAYWNDEAIAVINQAHEDGKLKKVHLRKITDKHSDESKAVAQITRGIEFLLPHDFSIKCSKNVKRLSFRVKWWLSLEGKTFRESNFGNKFSLPEITIPKEFFDTTSIYYQEPYKIYDSQQPILFIGHYCLGGGKNQFPAPNVCCVDSCVASGGSLSAYRYDEGDTELHYHKMVSVVGKNHPLYEKTGSVI